MTKLNTYSFGKELAEKYGIEQHKADVGGTCTVLDNETVRGTIETLFEEGLNSLPDDEELSQLQISIRPFDIPKVTVWCKSSGFNHRNNKCGRETTYNSITNRSMAYLLDVRPF